MVVVELKQVAMLLDLLSFGLAIELSESTYLS